MSTQSNRSNRVGLLLLTRAEDEETMVAHLEKRLASKDGKPVSWPGIHLVTVGTKLKADEDELTALYRQLKERFGAFVGSTLADILLDSGPNMRVLFKGERVTHYGLVVPRDLMNSVQSRSGDIHLTQVTARDLSHLVKAKKDWKQGLKHGPLDRKGIVVFPHTQAALRKALKSLY